MGGLNGAARGVCGNNADTSANVEARRVAGFGVGVCCCIRDQRCCLSLTVLERGSGWLR
jgi:hypothetical protein